MPLLTGATADTVWRLAAGSLARAEGTLQQPGRGGDTRELLHVIMSVDRPQDRWVASRTPPLNPAFALVESFWILAGRNDASLPVAWNPVLPKYAGAGSEFHGAYGFRIRRHFGIDQLQRIYQVLDSNPNSRQAVLQIWDSRIDLPNTSGEPASLDVPCNVVSIPKIRNGRLEWLQVMRSNDVFRGFPYNVVQFTTMQETLAGWLGVAVGSYTHISDSLHAYVSDLDKLGSSLVEVPLPANVDSLALSKREWDEAFSGVMARLDEMAQTGVTSRRLRAVGGSNDAPTAYENALRIAAADIARRRGWSDLASSLSTECSNAALLVMWNRWHARSGGLQQAENIHA